VVTKLDVLDELAEIPVCVSYMVDGKKTMEIPAQAMVTINWSAFTTRCGLGSSTQGIISSISYPRWLGIIGLSW